MLDAGRRAVSYLAGVSLEDFLVSREKQDAVLYCLSVIGEAAKWVPPDVRASLPSVEWHRIRGMRNFVIHEYWSVDLNIVWDTVQQKLPQLVSDLEAYRG